MKFHSTRDKSTLLTAREAVIRGLAPDGGLYMPAAIPELEKSFFSKLRALSFPEIAFEVCKVFFDEDIESKNLETLVDDAFNFPVPLIKHSEHTYFLELFHGPTAAFKDFGARFMARLMSEFLKTSDKQITILVATSGDTGGAVAQGFLKIPGIEVVLLYPKGLVSELQEKQFTTLGNNITALEISGSFDDCQRLVKTAFVDEDLREKMNLASANSINVARLIPQSLYYFYTGALLGLPDNLVFSIPSGNFGNLTAGIFANRMGLPVKQFIAATNANDTFLRYLETESYCPKGSVHTLSNAMDVGDPSNFERLKFLFNNDAGRMREQIWSRSYSDAETRKAMAEYFQKTPSYTLDPHGAVGLCALNDYLLEHQSNITGVVLETAHPAKFSESVNQIIGQNVEIPDNLKQFLGREKLSITQPNDFPSFKDFLLSR